MRVIHVINGLGGLGGGGAEQSLKVQLPALRDLGVESSVVCMVDREGPLAEEIRDAGFAVSVLAAGTWPGRVIELRNHLRRERPDLVHATIFAACIASRLACIGLDAPLLNSLVNTSYDPVRVQQLGLTGWKHEVVRRVDRVSARHLVTHFHALTEAVRREGIDVLGIAPERITVIPRGRSVAAIGEPTQARRVEARARLGFGPRTPIVLNIGRLEQQKAQALLVRAFALVRAEAPDAKLLIVGRDGAASADVAAAIAETDGGGSVEVLGHRTDVLDLLAAADVFAFPSHFEGLGCSAIEALAMGVPVVGSDAPAVAEVLGDGRWGRVVPRGDAVALARAVSSLLADEHERNELGAAGRLRFLADFQLASVARDTLALYEQVARRR